MPFKLLLSFLLLMVIVDSQAQTILTRELPAKRTNKLVVIDGIINEEAWKDAAVMDSLVDFRLKIGAQEDFQNRTEAYLMYDDEGIYFAGYCHERTRDSIASELKGRDGFGTNDYIGIIFDTYLDRINGFEYFLTPLNEQWDAKVSPSMNNNGGEDFSWNAVWKSGTAIHHDGWSFEMFIPYSAIRFGKKPLQHWGMNITRRRRKTEQQYVWNPIDPNKNGFLTQEGIWKGISDIKPPLRLQFSPYFSMYANHYPVNLPGEKNWTSQVNGGMDVKLGLNQAFTFDATLIPDFGQVQSDNQVLNLTPFEVKFNENRSFFTEGTELFSKGNLFYSRRIGGTPLHLYDVYDGMGSNEELLKNPAESKLVNASKISGRTSSGLGIGFLNAITKTQYATLQDINSKEVRKVETDPLTNYNILVLDQTLKNNSSVTLVNTNVLRSGSDYDANVTAALFDFNDKKNTWNVGGKIANSNLFNYNGDNKSVSGLSTNLYFGKTSGRLNFNIWQDMTDTKYSHNDLGYFTNNNYIDHGGIVEYKWLEPKGWYNRIFVNINGSVRMLFKKIEPIEKKYQEANLNFNFNAQTRKLSWVGFYLGYNPPGNDFYEPRQQGYYFYVGPTAGMGLWYESNAAKRFSFSTEVIARKSINFYNSLAINWMYNQVFRFNNKFSISHQLNLQPRFNNMGYSGLENGSVIFGRRKINTVENIVNVKYNFNNRMGINFRTRHYSSTVENKEYFTLVQSTGKLQTYPGFAGNANQNVNFLNVDMVYTWQFAPGSFINIVWKDAGFTFSDKVEKNYFLNFANTVEADQNNNFSIKVIYFLDYLKLKKAVNK